MNIMNSLTVGHTLTGPSIQGNEPGIVNIIYCFFSKYKAIQSYTTEIIRLLL